MTDCITSAQIAADVVAAFGPVIEQLILLSWMWAAVFFFLGGVFGPAVAHAFLVVARAVCRRIRRTRAS